MKCLFAIVFVSIILVECIHAAPIFMAGRGDTGDSDDTLVLIDGIGKLKVYTLILPMHAFRLLSQGRRSII